MRTARDKAVVFGFVLFGAIVLAVYASEYERSPHAAPLIIAAPTRPPSPNIGQTVRLTGSQGRVPLGVTKDDLDAFVRTAAAKDTEGISQILASGHLFSTDSGSSALVIDGGVVTGLPASRVRLKDGPDAGRDGWALDSALVP